MFRLIRLVRSVTPAVAKSRRFLSRRSLPNTYRLGHEPLEDRRVLSAVTVTNNLDLVNGDTSSIAALMSNDGGDGIALREAIEVANNTLGADEIDFDFGHDGPETILLELGELEITEALTITGDGADLLTIDAQQNSRIFNVTAETGDFTFEGMTITGGKTTGDNADSSDTTYSGGAIRSMTDGTLTVDRVEVSKSSTDGDYADGGGVFAAGDVTVLRSLISNNTTAGASGGGVFAGGAVTVVDSNIFGNHALGAVYGGGGGISSGGSTTLTNSSVSLNATLGDHAAGGGINSGGPITLSRSTVAGNFTVGISAHGGGVYSVDDVTITNSTISGNRTRGATALGGGVFSNGFVTLALSTVSGNGTKFDESAADGGGIWNSDAPMVITGSIIAGNTAGGANPDLRPGLGTLTVDYSLIGDTSDLTGDQLTDINAGVGNLLDIDPMLGYLDDNGGPTLTHALLPGSPAIDAGDSSFAGPPGNDQRGSPFVRVAGAVVDIGAYEVQSLALSVDTDIDEDDGDISVGDLSLREALVLTNANPGNDTVDFAAGLAGSTILMDGREFELNDDLTLNGLGVDQITIDAQGMSRVMVVNGSATVEINGLTLTGGSADNGAGLRNYGNTTLRAVAIVDNTVTWAYGRGAGIWNENHLAVFDSTISDNMAPGENASGGGIYSGRTSATFSIVGSTVSNNYAGSDGGGVSNPSGRGMIIDSTISNNTAGERGGGVNSTGGLSISGTTISGNEAGLDGGGVMGFGYRISHSTVVDNLAGSNGGGLRQVTLYSWLDHSIVANNTAVFGGNDVSVNSYYDMITNFSLIEDPIGAMISGANNITGVDPMLGPLADNGGPTMTHALLPGSPAIDAGDPGFVAPPYLDQRGYYRVVDGDGDMTARIDIGAFEFASIVAKPGDGNLDGVVDGLDYLLWAVHFADDPALDPPGAPLNGDYNGDDRVDELDYVVWAEIFEASIAAAPAAQTIEPLAATAASVPLAADAALEIEYHDVDDAADATITDDADVSPWQLGRAFDAVLNKTRGYRPFRS